MALALYLVLALWFVPRFQVSHLDGLSASDRFDKENESRKTIAQIFGGAAVLVGLWLTVQQIRVSQDMQRIAEQGQATERLTKAVTQLSSELLEIRLGGIYALERIANDSATDHWPAMEILTAFVRQHAPIKQIQSAQIDKDKPPVEIQAVLTVIGRRNLSFGNGETERLDLNSVDLRGVNLMKAHLEGVMMNGAQLDGAMMFNAYFDDAFLAGASLREADLDQVSFRGAILWGSDFTGAKFRRTFLERASVAIDPKMVLGRVGVPEKDVTKGLTPEQISGACIDGLTMLTPQLQRALRSGTDCH